jgi:hypothetical protein
MDHNFEEEDKDLKTKIIFAMQGLGGVRTVNHQITAYIKGTHC